jgi:hypothetical protein
MDKKHELYVKSPVYFGLASMVMPVALIIASVLDLPTVFGPIFIFAGFACSILGIIYSCKEKDKSEDEMKYSRVGVWLCLFTFVIYLMFIWLFASFARDMAELVNEFFHSIFGMLG